MGLTLGPQAVETDTILLLDAKNPISYNGVGTIWYDLSGKGNHFTLQNNPTHTPTTGELGFNTTQGGLNQYAICTNTDLGNFGSGSFTVEIVHKYVAASNGYPALINKRYAVTNITNGARGFFWNPIANIFVGDNSAPPSGDYQIGNLNNITTPNTTLYQTLTIKRNGLQMTGSLYTNSNLYGDKIQYLQSGDGSIDTIRALQLMLSYGEGGYVTGSLYTVRMYARDLSQSEISRNYTLYRNYYNF